MAAAPVPAAPEPDPAAAEVGAERITTGMTSPTSDAGAAAPPAGSGFGRDGAAPAAAAIPQDGGSTDGDGAQRARKGPLSFLSGALTSLLLAWLSLGLSQRVVGYYAEHPPHYSAQFAQSIATAMKTLIVGMCFLATFSFAFIGLGLTLTFVRSLLPGSRAEGAS